MKSSNLDFADWFGLSTILIVIGFVAGLLVGESLAEIRLARPDVRYKFIKECELQDKIDSLETLQEKIK